MAENSEIEWTHHTFNPSCLLHRGEKLQAEGVHQPMTGIAERDPVRSVGAPAWVICKRKYVVDMEVPTLVVTAVTTRKSVSNHAVISPPFVLVGKTNTAALNALSVNIAWRILSARSSLSGTLANFGSGFCGMSFPKPIAWPCLSGFAHFRATFGAHFLPLHRGDKCRLSLLPAFFGCFTAGSF